MLPLRRCPGLVYNHVYLLASIFICLALLCLLLSWGFICTDWEPRSQVDKLCDKFRSGLAVGDLCRALCIEKSIGSLSCQAFHAGKEVVFKASLGGKRKAVFKSAQKSDSHDVFDQEHYPTEHEFVAMIQHVVVTRLNLTISEEEGRRLSVFGSGKKSKERSEERRREMREVWRLLKDNEYLLSMVYSEKDLFPQLIGSCGQLFAVEHLRLPMETEMSKMVMEEGSDGWGDRVRLALQLLTLVEDLESEGLLMCDVKPSHFGISASGRLKALDLDVTLPKTLVDSITGDGRPCTRDSQCALFDCKSPCNQRTRVCDSPVVTTNFQVVCEKILVGWSVQNGIVLAGLLMTPHTSSSLAALLRQCSHEDDPHLRQRVIATLSEMDSILND